MPSGTADLTLPALAGSGVAEMHPYADVLAVTVSTEWPTERILPVIVDTTLTGAGDAGAVLKVTALLGGTRSRAFPILVDTVDPDGTPTALDAPDPGATGATLYASPGTAPADVLNRASVTYREAVGGAPTAEVSVEGHADLTGITAARLAHLEQRVAGAYLREATFPVAANAYGLDVAFGEAGNVATTVTTLDAWRDLNGDEHLLPELMPVDDDGQPYTLESDIAFSMPSEDDCAARGTIAGDTGPVGTTDSTWPTRRELAEQAAATAGFTVAVLGDVPFADRHVPLDYTTEDKTVRQVIADMLLDSNPRLWLQDTVIFVDGRDIAAVDVNVRDGTEWLGVGNAPTRGSLGYTMTPPEPVGPEPVLADYEGECGGDAPAAPGDGGYTGVPGTTAEGTFETFENGTYEYTTRGGTGDDYQEIVHVLTKEGGQLTAEVQETHGYYEPFPNTRYFGVIGRSEIAHEYHAVCPEALLQTVEVVRQRKSRDDLQFVTTAGVVSEEVDEGAPPWSLSDAERLYDAIPDWYAQRQTRVQQEWHAEGWLKSRVETSRELDGMVAQEVSAGVYQVTLTYRATSKTETYLPIGNGLWHIQTVLRTTEQRPVYEPVNPNAAPGDDDYGAMEITNVLTMPATHAYTVVTDRSPSTVSCGGDNPCDERPCEERAADDFEYDHAVWEARVRNGRARRVWRFQSPHPRFDLRVGQIVAGGFIASVTHTVEREVGTTDVEVWEFLP